MRVRRFKRDAEKYRERERDSYESPGHFKRLLLVYLGKSSSRFPLPMMCDTYIIGGACDISVTIDGGFCDKIVSISVFWGVWVAVAETGLERDLNGAEGWEETQWMNPRD